MQRRYLYMQKLQNQFENLKIRFYLSSIYAAGGYLRVIPEWFHLIRNGNGHIWVGALGVNQIKSCNLTHGGENFYTEGGWRGKGNNSNNLAHQILHIVLSLKIPCLKFELEASDGIVAHVTVQQHCVILVQRRHLEKFKFKYRNKYKYEYNSIVSFLSRGVTLKNSNSNTETNTNTTAKKILKKKNYKYNSIVSFSSRGVTLRNLNSNTETNTNTTVLCHSRPEATP